LAASDDFGWARTLARQSRPASVLRERKPPQVLPLDLKKHDRAEAIAALEAIVARLKE